MPSKHVLPRFRIAVVGTGAVGGYYGAKLAYYGRDVHFLVRNEEERARLQRFGLQIKSREGNFRVAKVQAHATTEEIGPCDLVIIALKATANDALPAVLPPLLGPETVLLMLQNGLGGDEFLAERFGAERVLGGLCFVCLNKTAPGVIEHGGYGTITLGEFAGYPLPRTHDLAWELKRCGVVTRVVADLAEARWRKLVWNIPFNGLTLLGTAMRGPGAAPATTADVLADDALAYLARGLMGEVIAAARKLGHANPGGFCRSPGQAHHRDEGVSAQHAPGLSRRPTVGTGCNLGRTLPAGVQCRGGSRTHGNTLLPIAERHGVFYGRSIEPTALNNRPASVVIDAFPSTGNAGCPA